MRAALMSLVAWLAWCGGSAHANLCDSVKDTTTTAETKLDVDFYQQLFPDTLYQGSRRWNEIVVQCNRQRDTQGGEVKRAIAVSGNNADKNLLKSADLDPKVIRGHYNFFGIMPFQLKYVYVLSKKGGVWTMIIPYKAVFNELVADRVDFYAGWRGVNTSNDTVSALTPDGHAWQLYDATQIITTKDAAGKQTQTLKTGARPIAETLCSTSTFFTGKEDKYDGQNNAFAYKRDPENKFISLGRIQYRYKDQDWMQEGCRVLKSRDLYWLDPALGQVVKVKPQDWILDNFVRTAESYWSGSSKFQLKLLLRGRNDADFAKSTLALLQDDDYLTVRFATKFLPYHYNQMYKSNVIQFNNFSTMTTDGTYWHEVGHAFGLDDEYGGEKTDKTGASINKQNSCENTDYSDFSPTTYQMCDAGVTDLRSIYHYIAASRYITKQNECDSDGDCANAEYCDKGTITIGKNQCVAKKADNDACAISGGDHQCKSGTCKLGRCYTEGSVAMGGICYVDDACSQGKCSSVGGTKGTCVCNEDSDCGTGRFCNGGADLSKNTCEALKNDNEACAAVGGGHQCKGGHCNLGRCYTPQSVAMGGTCYVDDACKEGKCSAIDGTRGTCVCKEDSDCGTGKYCDGGADFKTNVCRAKLDKGESCGKFGSVGNDHKCKSGECSGAPSYKCK